MRQIVLIVHNVRSCYNVGSMLRTAEGLGINKVYLTGYSPYPKMIKDKRLPHLAEKVHRQIAKTALGAEETQDWQYSDDINKVLDKLKAEGYTIAALEQTLSSRDLSTYKPPDKLAIVVGREVEGLENEIIEMCDLAIEIPMRGKKESFNVTVAAAMAMFYTSIAPLSE